MKHSIVLITKDILIPQYLKVYGNKYWSTPNIDELADKGTVFQRHYTAAPSTSMSFWSMATGKYPYESENKVYQHVKRYEGKTIFDRASEMGMKSHVVWSDNYMKLALPYVNCFQNAEIHTLDINQPVGPHLPKECVLTNDEAKTRSTMTKLYETLDTIPDNDVFIWLHLPHVILGRTCYGEDMDLLDEIVGYFRKKYEDDSIFISADHGNMNGSKGVTGYGFHVYESAIRIPFITPRIENLAKIDFPTSNTQLGDVIFDRYITKPEYVLSDTAFYLQFHRKLAIIYGKYKYIYNKADNSEELYDVMYDPSEERNLLNKLIKDVERHRNSVLSEVYFYPEYERIDGIYTEIKKIKDRVWRNGTKKEETKIRIHYWIGEHFRPIIMLLKKKNKKIVRKD